jgi:hypothetical protein
MPFTAKKSKVYPTWLVKLQKADDSAEEWIYAE